jgi:acetyl esterase/lipase
VKVHGQYWAGDADTHHWQVSPLFGEMAGLPPVAIYCGTRELLCPDIRLAFDRLLAAGVDATLRVGTGLNHDWPLMPIPEADAAFEEIVEMIG